MKLRARRYWLSLLALTFLATLAVNPALTLAYASYQASAGFSSSQGSNQWYYQKWDGSSYTNLNVYDSAAWKGETYLFVKDDTQHPDASDSVRTWIAPSSGIVVITGNVAKEDTSGPSNLSDGVNAKILLNSTELYNRDIAYNDGNGHDVDITVLVNQGDALYFRVNKKGTVWYDETRWNPTVTYVQSTFDAVDDFSGTQGSSQWYYQKWDGSSYTDITNYDSQNAAWTAEQYLSVKANGHHPDGSDSVRKWVAPYRGTVSITGNVAKADINGPSSGNDGVNAKILLNDTQLYSLDIDAHDGVGDNVNLSVDVNVGDAIYFRVNKRGTVWHDETKWEPTITYTSVVSTPFQLGTREQVYSYATLQGLGLPHFPDGVMGVVKNTNDYTFYSSNASGRTSTARVTGSLIDPADTVDYSSKAIANLPSYIDYATVGPVHKTDAGDLIGFLHLERHPGNDWTKFDGSLGLAISEDGGWNWTWCGEFMSHGFPYNDDPNAVSFAHEVGGGSFVIVDGYFYVYAADFTADAFSTGGLSVSRALVSEVVAACKDGTALPTFYKYYNGSWSEPALGGNWTNVLVGGDTWPSVPSVSYNTYLDKYILVHSSNTSNPANRPGTWGTNRLAMRISDDPTKFDGPEYIIDDAGQTNYVNQYPTIVGTGSNPQTESGQSFYVYFLNFDGTTVWGTYTSLMRKEITLN